MAVGRNDVVTLVVLAPILGTDLSWLEGIDPRVRVLDANDAWGDPALNAQGGDPAAPPASAADEMLAEADILLFGYPVPRVLAARAPHLAWAHHTQAGVSNISVSDLWQAPILLTSSRGTVGVVPIAEYAVAGAAHFARGLHEGSRQKAAGELSRTSYDLITLRGATMGIIGFGGIGQEVGRLSQALGMRVVATRRSVTEARTDTDGADLVLPADRILEVAGQSDFLAVCSQLTAETEHMINAEVLAAVKPGCVLINVARGEEVDEDALLAALASGRLRGAVLDVYDGELAGRPPRPELASTPEILLTPHISTGGQSGLRPQLRELFLENLRRFLAEEPLLNLVDRERGY